MSVQYLELEDNRVLSVEMNPGPEVPGYCERQVRISVERGNPFTFQEWQLISSCLAGLPMSAGCDGTEWDELLGSIQ